MQEEIPSCIVEYVSKIRGSHSMTGDTVLARGYSDQSSRSKGEIWGFLVAKRPLCSWLDSLDHGESNKYTQCYQRGALTPMRHECSWNKMMVGEDQANGLALELIPYPLASCLGTACLL